MAVLEGLRQILQEELGVRQAEGEAGSIAQPPRIALSGLHVELDELEAVVPVGFPKALLDDLVALDDLLDLVVCVVDVVLHLRGRGFQVHLDVFELCICGFSHIYAHLAELLNQGALLLVEALVEHGRHALPIVHSSIQNRHGCRALRRRWLVPDQFRLFQLHGHVRGCVHVLREVSCDAMRVRRLAAVLLQVRFAAAEELEQAVVVEVVPLVSASCFVMVCGECNLADRPICCNNILSNKKKGSVRDSWPVFL